jgi:hypothetical protein
LILYCLNDNIPNDNIPKGNIISLILVCTCSL